MYNYIDTITADYTAETLSVTPQKVMKIPGRKAQIIHELDDNSISVISESESSQFSVELQWDHLSETEHATIFDFWHNTAKANGMKNTFKWQHPLDGEVYVVRFLTDIKSKFYPYPHPGIQKITLNVEGLSA